MLRDAIIYLTDPGLPIIAGVALGMAIIWLCIPNDARVHRLPKHWK